MTGHSPAIWQSRMWPRSSTSSIQMASNGRAFGPPLITRRKRNWLAYKTLQSRRRGIPDQSEISRPASMCWQSASSVLVPKQIDAVSGQSEHRIRQLKQKGPDSQNPVFSTGGCRDG